MNIYESIRTNLKEFHDNPEPPENYNEVSGTVTVCYEFSTTIPTNWTKEDLESDIKSNLSEYTNSDYEIVEIDSNAPSEPDYDDIDDSEELKESILDVLKITKDDLYKRLQNTPQLDNYENYEFDERTNQVSAQNKTEGKWTTFKLVLTPTDDIPNLEAYKIRIPDELEIGEPFLISK